MYNAAKNNILIFTANTANSTVALHSYHTDTTTFNGITYTNTPAEKCPNVISLEYSTNGVTWHSYTFTNVVDENDDIIGFTGQVITLHRKGDYVMLRASADNRFQWVKFTTHSTGSNAYRYDMITGWYQFLMTGSIKATGNIMALLHKAGANFNFNNRGGFYKLFLDCTALTVAPYLSATVLPDNAYAFMFQGCTNLAKVSFTSEQMEADNRAWQFMCMFKGCSSLTDVSDLNIHLNAYSRNCGFNQMFYGCTSLVNVPKITTREGSRNSYGLVGNDAYLYMFKDCTNILDASHIELHNPNAAVYASKMGMFENCTKLEYPPVIIGGFFNGMPSRSSNSCSRFFHNCQALKEIILDHSYPFTYYTGSTPPTWGWVDGVPETGDFFKREDFPLIRCKHMIPLKWDVHDIDSRPLCFEAEEAGNRIQLRKVGEPDEIPFEYSTDGTNWQKYDFSYISLPNIGDKVYFRCSENSNKYKSTYKGSDSYYRFYRSAGTFKVSGNLFTLLKMNGAKIFTATSSDRAFVSLFSSAGITSMPTLPDYGVYGDRALLNIFYGNANLANKSVELKFRNAKFWGKTFYYTFSYAQISEVTVDILEALFIGVSSASPFDNTFTDCSNLQKIKVRFSSWVLPYKPTTNKCAGWVNGVAENGVFVCPKTLEEIHDINHIPVGWTVKRWYEEMGEQYPSVATLMQQYTDLEDVVDTYPEVAPFLDQYPNLVHSLVNTGSTPYMKMYGDGMETDVYPHELMEMIATFETSANPYSIDFGILFNNTTTRFEIAMRYNTSSDFYDVVAFGDVSPAGTTHFQLADGKHTISVSKNGAFADGIQMTGNNIKIGDWMAMTEASNKLRFPGPISINKTRTFGLEANVAGENKFYELILKEDSVVTHRFVPIANRVIADIGDLTNIKIYQCTLASETQTEQRTSVFGLE